jgi:hypothetical protein
MGSVGWRLLVLSSYNAAPGAHSVRKGATTRNGPGWGLRASEFQYLPRFRGASSKPPAALRAAAYCRPP